MPSRAEAAATSLRKWMRSRVAARRWWSTTRLTLTQLFELTDAEDGISKREAGGGSSGVKKQLTRYDGASFSDAKGVVTSDVTGRTEQTLELKDDTA